MQIAIFSPGFPPRTVGGEEYYAYYQAKELARMGHSVIVIANGSKEVDRENSSSGAIRIHFVKPTMVKYNAIRYALITARFVLSFLRLKTRPNLIHGHDPYGEGLAAVLAGKIMNVPVVITWHAAELMETKAHFSIVGDICRLLALRGACRIIVNSEFFKKLAIGFIGDLGLYAKTRVVFPGVDTDEFSLKNDVNDFRSSLGAQNDFLVLAVCRLEKIKGLDILIRSIPSVLESFPNTKVIVVGSGNERESLEELAKKLHVTEHVAFTGTIQRTFLPYFYSACDVFVIPTQGEGFGMAFLEAWSCSKPIIVTRHAPEIAKLVRVFGGGLVVGDSSLVLSNAIVKLLSNNALRYEMGRIGRYIAESKYSWKKTALANVQVYRELS
jgi:glycosyltransferase involved in cell wall biosynthesis